MKERDPSNKNRPPFKVEFEDARLNIRTIKNNPEKIVRAIFTTATVEEEVQKQKRGRALLLEYANRYHVAIPSFDVVIGEDEEGYPYGETVYTVVDRIYGKVFEEILADPFEVKKMAPEIDELLSKQIIYWKDKFEAQEEFLWDLHENQFMYGRRVGEDTDQFYLVDIEPRYRKADREAENVHFLFKILFYKRDSIHRIESAGGIKLSKTRDQLTAFLTSMPKDLPEYERAEYLLENLKE